MNFLDNYRTVKKYDRQNMLSSIESLGLQCQQAWSEVSKLKIPSSYRQADSVVISGMGGSALGGHVIESLFGQKIKVPLKVVNSYHLPGFVNNRTLVLVSTYSGTTEETLAAFYEARKKRAKIMVICAGGALAKLAKRFHLPGYIFSPDFNPCNQPRMGLGYSIFGQIALLKKCGLLPVGDQEVNQAIRLIVGLHKQFGFKAPLARNQAKKVAVGLRGRMAIPVSAEHLAGNAHVLANQINENAKNFSAYYLLSELNHHLMEGLKFPVTNRRQLVFLFLESKLHSLVMLKRVAITKKVLIKNHILFVSYLAKSRTPLLQAMEILLFGSYVNYYLALLNGLNPSPIPFVDFFKKQLSAK